MKIEDGLPTTETEGNNIGPIPVDHAQSADAGLIDDVADSGHIENLFFFAPHE
jgi:hypothetical protein